MNNTELANLLFPDVTETIADLQAKYPPRRCYGSSSRKYEISLTGY